MTSLVERAYTLLMMNPVLYVAVDHSFVVPHEKKTLEKNALVLCFVFQTSRSASVDSLALLGTVGL